MYLDYKQYDFEKQIQQVSKTESHMFKTFYTCIPNHDCALYFMDPYLKYINND